MTKRTAVERVAQAMYEASVIKSERKFVTWQAPLWRLLLPAWKEAWLAVAATHLREVQRVRGRTVGYVEVVSGTNDGLLASDTLCATIGEVQSYADGKAIVGRVVLVPKKRRRK